MHIEQDGAKIKVTASRECALFATCKNEGSGKGGRIKAALFFNDSVALYWDDENKPVDFFGCIVPAQTVIIDEMPVITAEKLKNMDVKLQELFAGE